VGLSFFNTYGRRVEEFQPLEPGVVRLYTCGPTVYNFAHIGNFRTFVFEDVLRRYLRFRGFRVVQVMNLTDVDDKTIRGSREAHVPLREYTDRYAQAFFEDLDALRIERAEFYPRATEHVSEMVELVRRLQARGLAYESEQSYYYDISAFPAYGKLSGIATRHLKPEAKVRADEYSKDEVQDFALWKAWDEADGEVAWNTELGRGRPGWHLECSAMSMKYLGETFDLHCGGVDLIFPHHENEIAQSEGATGKPFVRYWLHCAHLMVEGQRMAKSLQNEYTLRDVQAHGFSMRALRYLLLAGHYRAPINFTWEGMRQAEASVQRLADFAQRLDESAGHADDRAEAVQASVRLDHAFQEAMDADLDTPRALAVLFDFVREINRLMDREPLSIADRRRVLERVNAVDRVLALLPSAPPDLPAELQALVAAREDARKRRDWARADALRVELQARGIVLEDTPQGVRWKRQRPSPSGQSVPRG
jgi:cysteinyl-tRNA synthetase